MKSEIRVCDNVYPVDSIDSVFSGAGKDGRAALIVYLCGGYPDLETSKELALASIEAGADIVELGMPFSDPLADGPVLQLASKRAIEKGATMEKILNAAGEIRTKKPVPLVMLSYYNPILQLGLDTFSYEASRAGINGVIVPDLPMEESIELNRCCAEHEISFIPLICPNSTDDRVKKIASTARGFIYCVSSTGTTGGNLEDFTPVESLLTKLRKTTSKPLAIGFGIGSPAQAAQASKYGDGIIVGSAIARVIESNSNSSTAAVDKVYEYVKELRASCVR